MSDNDLIRRGDALYAIAGWEIPSTAIAALPAVTPKVRPLEWEPSVIGKPWHSAKAPWGWYYAQWDDETQAWFASLEMGEIEAPIILSPSDVPTLEAAKAAAQADYASRSPALDLTPGPVTQSFGAMICGRSGCGMGGPCMWEKCEHPLATPDAQAADDPECTDCGGSGVTYQTERHCSCQPAPDAAAIREAALREARQRVNDLVAERQADLHGARNDFNRGAVDALQEAYSAILALIPKGAAE